VRIFFTIIKTRPATPSHAISVVGHRPGPLLKGFGADKEEGRNR
jgi:hypothetical protein